MQIHYDSLLFSLSRALDFIEQELVGITTNHSKRVAYLCLRMAQELNLRRHESFDMGACAILHDNALTEYMLLGGRQYAKQLQKLEMHCILGENNAKHFPFMSDTTNVILHHHENWDGSGYFGLKGKETIVRAAILRLADQADLLFGMGIDPLAKLKKVRRHVQSSSGRLYAPEVAEAFLELADEEMVFKLSDQHIDRSLMEALPHVERDIPLPKVMEVCHVFSKIIDAKSPFTSTHSQGIAEKVRTCGEDYGFDKYTVDKLVMAAWLHDVGKLSTPLSVLEKPGKLDDAEFRIMRNHVNITHQLLTPVQGLEDVALWAASHHERPDGKGYHLGLNASQLPKQSLMLSCVDVYQALTEDRPYRAGMSHKEASTIMHGMMNTGGLDKEMGQAVLDTLSRAF